MPLVSFLIILGVSIVAQIIVKIICTRKLKRKVKEINERIKDDLVFYDEKTINEE